MDKNYYMQQSIDTDGIAPVYNPSRIQTSPHGAFINAPMGVNVGQYFNNNTIDSKYIEDLGDVNAAIRAGRTVEDLLAEKQSGWEMAGNALLNNVVIAGTSIVSGTLGVVDGILEALANGDSSRVWDNSVNDWATNIQDATKEYFPIYRGEEYNNASIWEKMGTGIFWADLVENLGFTEGMLVPGMAASRIFQGLGKGATMLGGAFVSSIGEGSIEAIQERNDEVKNKIAIANQRYNELASQSKDSELSELYDNYLKTIQDIEDDANNAGNFTFGANLALLTLTNTIEFGNLFSRGFSTSRKVAGQLARDGEKYIADSSTKAIAKSAGKKVIDAFSEGMEEVSQAAISGTSQYYTDYNKFNESIFNPDKRELVGNLISAFGESYANTLQDPQTAEEFASGFIIGLTGAPQLRKAKIPIKIENNIIGDIYDAIKNNRREQELAKNINDRLSNSKQFNAYYEGLVRHLALQDDINTAIDEADHTAFDNATSAQLISDIIMFVNAGHLNHLKELVNNSVDLSDEGINAIIEETSKDGNGPFINNGNKIDVDEVRELIKRKQDYINHKIDFISEIKSELEAAFPELNENGLGNAIFLRSQIEDHQTRFNSLKDEVRAGIAKLFNSYINNEASRKTSEKKSRKGTIYVRTKDGKKAYINPKDIDYFDVDGTVVLKGENLSNAEVNPYKKFIPTENTLLANLNNPAFREIVQDLLNSDNSTMPHNEKVKLSEAIRDLGKLQAGIVELNKNLTEALKNPNKTNNSRQEALDKKEEINKVSEDVKIKDKIDNADVSEIVQGMESGDLDEGQLDGLFSNEDNEFLNNIGTEGQSQPSGRQKVEEAKNIIKTSQRMNRAIDGLNDGSIDPQALADAHTLLQHSKQVSESEQEMLNTASQAYNDPTLLYDENDPSMQDVSQEELESILGERTDAAKSVIEQAKAVLSEQNDELNGLPEGAPVVREITPEEAQGRETGHDATEHTPTENERQRVEAVERAVQALSAEEQAKVNDLFQDLKEGMSQENVRAFDKAVSEVLKSIDMLIGAKATSKEIGKLIKNTQSYQIAKQLAPELDDYLNVYVTSRLNPKATEPVKQEEEPKIATPVITDQEVRQQTTAQRTVDPNQEEFTGTYQYWKPTTSYLPFGRAFVKGDNTPFYKIARTLRNQDGTPVYSEPTLRRIEAVGKYLEDHGAFKLVDSGAVKAGSNVHFTIDSTLNDQAGELVILMTDDQGRVIGDVMSSTDPRFANQLGLPQLVERITAEYKEAGSPQHFTSKEVTTVDTNKVGKIPFLADHEVMHTLNEVFVDGEQQVPFKIGIAATGGKNARILASAGRTKKQGQSDLERSINPPLTAKAGQPFLLLPTSSSINAYMTVPFMMDSYSPATQGTALGKAIHKILERVPTSDNANVIGIINDLEELLSVQEIHINYNGDNVKVTIKPNGAEHQMTIYNGAKNAPNIVEQLELGLQGQPFQVSRKYMNEDYDGQDYNRMIGEVAKVNLPIGTTHTVSDWFTIKPINAAGQQMKTKSPRSTGSNPHAATPQYITITKKGVTLNVNPVTWEVTDSTGKVYTGPNANKVKAQAFGMHMNKNMEQPYDTEWGYYDPKTDEFVEKPNIVLRTLGVQQGTRSFTVIKPPYHSSMKAQIGVKKSNWDYYTESDKETRQTKEGKVILGNSMQATLQPAINYAVEAGILSSEHKIPNASVSIENSNKVRNAVRILKGLGINTPQELIEYVEQHEGKGIKPNEVPKTIDGQQDTLSLLLDWAEGRLSYRDAVSKLKGTDYVKETKGSKALGIPDRIDFTSRVEEKLGEYIKSRYPFLDVKEVTMNTGFSMYGGGMKLLIVTDTEGNEYGKPSSLLRSLATNPDGNLATAIKKLSFSQTGTQPIETPAQLEDKAKKAGLLGNKVRQALWQVLTPEQQSIIANKKSPKQKYWMDVLEIAFDPATNTFDEAKLKGTVDEFLGRKALYSRTDEYQEPYKLWDKERELQWLQKALPNLSTSDHLTLVDGLIRINDSSNPGFAYGKFQEGMITISDIAARGTAYHEAFHAVVHTLLNEREYQRLFDAASERWSNITDPIELEEKLAEDFRRFMQSEEEWYDNLESKNYSTIGKTLAILFHKLKNFINRLSKNTPYINKLYYNINRGKFARRKVGKTNTDIRYKYANKVSELEYDIKAIDQDIQSIRNQRRLAAQNKAAIKWRTVNGKRYAQINTVGYLFESEALKNIPNEYNAIVTPIGIYDGTSYRYYLHIKSKEESDEDIKQLKEYKERLKQQLERLKNNKWDIISEEALEEQEEVYYRRVEQYHRDKMLFENLSQEDKDYLQERGITQKEFSQMTQLEKEVLFHCKY